MVGRYTQAFRTRQLLETLDHAIAKSSFYQHHLGAFRHQVNSVDDLGVLPTIGKEHLARHGLEMRTSKAFPIRFGISSGSTWGDFRPGEPGDSLSSLVDPAISFQTLQEMAAMRHIQQRLFPQDSGNKSLTLQIISASHGIRYETSEDGYIHAPLESPFHYAHIKRLLRTRFDFDGYHPRIQNVAGGLNSIKLLSELIRHDPEKEKLDLRLERVLVYGHHLTRFWNRRLEEVFACPVLNIYGISEMSGATGFQCECGSFHMPPFIIPEVISLDRACRPVTQGVGELVLTALVPFTEYQPLIRYRTDDVVLQSGACPQVPDMGILPLGKKTKTIQGPDYILPSFLLDEVLEKVPWVPKKIAEKFAVFFDSQPYGPPIYTVNHRPGKRMPVEILIACNTPDRPSVSERARVVAEAGEKLLRIDGSNVNQPLIELIVT
ncbi:MAG: hypothetical protein HQL76_07045 [Magnetococcales bacterium]|nr:hypothetical protein [Magnetococcales bacterium]